MKRTILLMILVLSLALSGCCYAPGYEGDLIADKWYGTVPTIALGGYEPAPENTTGETSWEGTEPLETIFLPPEMPVEENDVFVNVREYIPDIHVDLRYATLNNFVGQVIYETDDVYLRYGTVAKLMEVQQALRLEGLSLKIWDAFRPASAQYKLWTAKPDPEFVANPQTGYSNHTRGNAVDLTLVDKNGQELEMPSAFDDFSGLADRDYSDCTAAAAENATKLESLMEEHGFSGYESEWWHFNDTDTYPVDNHFDPSAISTWYADCNEYINIRSEPDVKSTSIGKIEKGEQMTLLGWSGKMAYVRFEGIVGFVNGDYINRVE